MESEADRKIVEDGPRETKLQVEEQIAGGYGPQSDPSLVSN